jgi:hypothetical protein
MYKKFADEILAELLADNLAKRVYRNEEYKLVSIGKTLENYGYDGKHVEAVMAFKIACRQLGLDYGHGAIGSMRPTEETLKLGFDALKRPAIFAVINIENHRCVIGSSQSPWLRRAVIYYWLKNIHTFSDSNTFFGHKDLIEDVEKYGADAYRLHLIQEIPSDLDTQSRIALETEAEQLAGDKLYFSKNIPLRLFSPLKQFLYYYPELTDCERRFREIKEHYFKVRDKRESLKGTENFTKRRQLNPVLKAAKEEYDAILKSQTAIRDTLIKKHSSK